ncbi:sodium- and chloride-dependent glycine transporter 1-like [Babylonia areolata]|uniref:sodium- and chloride-dependent glycine transporter 1-like n=1 Tax=Babylonia areolata TaxID=304850 RepID=UPI003FD2F296
MVTEDGSAEDSSDKKAVGEEGKIEAARAARGNWSNWLQYFLSTIGGLVGLGNVWRFPYVCYVNGGAAFLIPYLLGMAVCGVPMFLLETAVCQFSNLGPGKVWVVCPLFRGIGYSMVVMASVVCLYYNVIIALALYYLLNSFSNPLPWSSCHNEWNTNTCIPTGLQGPAAAYLNPSPNSNHNVTMGSLVSDVTNVTTSLLLNVTEEEGEVGGVLLKAESSVAQFWTYHVLQDSGRSISDIGDIRWQLLLCLLAAWIAVFFCLFSDIKTSGKVVYVAAVLPYVVLLALLVRGCLLPGAMDGLDFYLMPQWDRLLDWEVKWEQDDNRTHREVKWEQDDNLKHREVKWEQDDNLTHREVKWEQDDNLTHREVKWEQDDNLTHREVKWEQDDNLTHREVKWEQDDNLTHREVKWEQDDNLTNREVKWEQEQDDNLTHREVKWEQEQDDNLTHREVKWEQDDNLTNREVKWEQEQDDNLTQREVKWEQEQDDNLTHREVKWEQDDNLTQREVKWEQEQDDNLTHREVKWEQEQDDNLTHREVKWEQDDNLTQREVKWEQDDDLAHREVKWEQDDNLTHREVKWEQDDNLTQREVKWEQDDDLAHREVKWEQDDNLTHREVKWEQDDNLTQREVWLAAAAQVFYSTGTACGGVSTLASFNGFHNNIYRDALVLPLLDAATSVFCGLVIFVYLGYMAYVQNTTVDQVITQGTGLAFQAYPEAVTSMPLSHLWAVLFFLALFTVGLDSQFVMVQTITSAIVDTFPRRLLHRKRWVTLVVCTLGFVLGLPFVTQGGQFVMQLCDWYVAVISVMLLAVAEVLVLGWVYGTKRLCADIAMMIGYRPHSVWHVLWKVITPGFVLVTWTMGMIGWEPIAGYPTWTVGVGWMIAVIPLIPVPIFALLQLYCFSSGSLRERFLSSLRPSPRWRPAVAHDGDQE